MAGMDAAAGHDGDVLPADRRTGIAYILTLPVMYVIVLFWDSWGAVAMLATIPFALPLWGLQWVIVCQTFFSPRNAFRFSRGVGRLQVAAWGQFVTTVGAWLVVVSQSGSAQVYGHPGETGGDELIATLAIPLALLAIVCTLWIIVEWIVALVRRRRARRG